jgi:hypothetical protein
MTLTEMRDMPLLSSVHLVVEDLELIIQRVPKGWAFVYHKTLTPINVVMGTLFIKDPDTIHGEDIIHNTY